MSVFNLLASEYATVTFKRFLHSVQCSIKIQWDQNHYYVQHCFHSCLEESSRLSERQKKMCGCRPCQKPRIEEGAR